jgi:hypothetical protein
MEHIKANQKRNSYTEKSKQICRAFSPHTNGDILDFSYRGTHRRTQKKGGGGLKVTEIQDQTT